MSLVGPRPFAVGESERDHGLGRAPARHRRPGITGLWQVLGRTDVAFDEMVKLDYIYVTNWSLWWDAKILLRTVPAVLRRARRLLTRYSTVTVFARLRGWSTFRPRRRAIR